MISFKPLQCWALLVQVNQLDQLWFALNQQTWLTLFPSNTIQNKSENQKQKIEAKVETFTKIICFSFNFSFLFLKIEQL